MSLKENKTDPTHPWKSSPVSPRSPPTRSPNSCFSLISAFCCQSGIFRDLQPRPYDKTLACQPTRVIQTPSPRLDRVDRAADKVVDKISRAVWRERGRSGNLRCRDARGMACLQLDGTICLGTMPQSQSHQPACPDRPHSGESSQSWAHEDAGLPLSLQAITSTSQLQLCRSQASPPTPSPNGSMARPRPNRFDSSPTRLHACHPFQNTKPPPSNARSAFHLDSLPPLFLR